MVVEKRVSNRQMVQPQHWLQPPLPPPLAETGIELASTRAIVVSPVSLHPMQHTPWPMQQTQQLPDLCPIWLWSTSMTPPSSQQRWMAWHDAIASSSLLTHSTLNLHQQHAYHDGCV